MPAVSHPRRVLTNYLLRWNQLVVGMRSPSNVERASGDSWDLSRKSRVSTVFRSVLLPAMDAVKAVETCITQPVSMQCMSFF